MGPPPTYFTIFDTEQSSEISIINFSKRSDINICKVYIITMRDRGLNIKGKTRNY